MKRIAVIMGSDSDLPVADKAVSVLKEFGIDYEVRVLSAHRTPSEVEEFSRTARENGFGAIISIAGLAAHLGGVIAANTTLPVIGIPVSGKLMGGLDAVFSTLQMPPGIPVAAVGLDNGKNAALLAIEMLAVTDETLQGKLEDYRASMRETVLRKDKEIRNGKESSAL